MVFSSIPPITVSIFTTKVKRLKKFSCGKLGGGHIHINSFAQSLIFYNFCRSVFCSFQNATKPFFGLPTPFIRDHRTTAKLQRTEAHIVKRGGRAVGRRRRAGRGPFGALRRKMNANPERPAGKMAHNSTNFLLAYIGKSGEPWSRARNNFLDCIPRRKVEVWRLAKYHLSHNGQRKLPNTKPQKR